VTGRDSAQPVDQRAVTVWLAELADRYRRELSGVAEVSVRFIDELGATATTLVPERAGAVGVNWVDFGSDGDLQVQVESEGGGGIFEDLARDLEGVGDVEAIADAVVEGRVRELLGAGRSRVEVIESDGSVTAETAHSLWRGLLPVPGWRRSARIINYLPYRRA